MGKDTKYLTLAAIVLMTIATLIVLTSTKRKATPSVTDNTTITEPMEDETSSSSSTNTSTKNKDLYADSDNGAQSQAVKDAYDVMSGDTKLVNETAETSKPKAKPTPQDAVPAAYEESSKPKADKFTEKSGEARKPKPKIAPAPKDIAEDTGPVYIVQTGVLANLAAAQKAQDALKAKGFKTAGTFHSGNTYLVYAGKFQNKESAQELKKRLDKTKISAFVKELK